MKDMTHVNFVVTNSVKTINQEERLNATLSYIFPCSSTTNTTSQVFVSD